MHSSRTIRSCEPEVAVALAPFLDPQPATSGRIPGSFANSMTTTRSEAKPWPLFFRLTAYVIGLVLGGLVLLLVFDLVIDDGATFWFSLVLRVWPVLPATAFTAAILFLISKRNSQRFVEQHAASPLLRIACALGFLAAAPILLLMVDHELYRPLKFSYLIRQVESAQTAQEELRAFRLADRWGYVWELNRHWRQAYLPPRARHLAGDWILELEWLECSPSGAPYCAYRRVLREDNLSVFHK